MKRRQPLKRKTPLTPTNVEPGLWQRRVREKAASRAEDQRRLESGKVTAEQLRKENASFAFSRARIQLSPTTALAERRKSGRKTKAARRERDWDRMAWIRTLRCTMVGHWTGPMKLAWRGSPMEIGVCRGPIEAHHAGVHGTGQRPADDTCIPMCVRHHRGDAGITDRKGPFTGWPPHAVKAWELAAIAHYQALYEAHKTFRTDTF